MRLRAHSNKEMKVLLGHTLPGPYPAYPATEMADVFGNEVRRVVILGVPLHTLRRAPESAACGDGVKAGARRSFQVLGLMDLLVEFTRHIPSKGAHLIRDYGGYRNKSRGMCQKAEQVAAHAKPPPPSKPIHALRLS